jgi:hypothetical protein
VLLYLEREDAIKVFKFFSREDAINIFKFFRKEDAINLDLIHIAKLDQNGTRFFYQKKKFRLPQYVPQSLPGICVEKFPAMYCKVKLSCIYVKIARYVIFTPNDTW